MQKLMFAHTAIHPLSRNASFMYKVIKNIEKMKVVFTKPAYLQQVMHFVSRICQTIVFYKENNKLCSCIFTVVLRHA